MSLLQSRISQVAVSLLLASSTLAASNNTVIPLTSSTSPYGTWFTVELQFGGQTLSVIADTGSADLWILASDWKCYHGSVTVLNGTSVPRENCPFNKTYTQTSTFQAIDNAWLGETYGQGDIVGSVGYEDVQIGSITLSQQEMAFANATINGVNSYVSGLLGLAYPVLDAVHPASYQLSNSSTLTAAEVQEQYLSNRISYATVIKRLLGMDVTYFGMALERMPLDQERGFGGYLSFETLPPVPHGELVTVPVEELKGIRLLFTNGTKQIAYWVLTVDAVTWDNETNSQPFQAVVDSGNSLNYLPNDIYTKVNAAFDPPGKLDSSTGWYSVDCSATPPANFSIQIGGQMFTIDSADMIWRDTSGKCWSSVSLSTETFGISTAILGDAFLKNVVTVFDYSQHEMKFAQRHANSSTPSPTSSSGGTAVGLDSRFLLLALAAVVLIVLL